MNYLDIAILVLLGLFLVKGAVRGLLKELCSLLGLGLGTFLAFRYCGPLGDWLLQGLSLPVKIGTGIAFAALFLGTIIFFILLGALLPRFVKLLFLGGFNRVAGGFFGLVQGVLFLAIVLFGLAQSPFPKALGPTIGASQLAPPFLRLGGEILRGSRTVLS